MNFLFVCTGNVCRSFSAHKLLAEALKGTANEVRSCGIAAQTYFRPPDRVIAFLNNSGIADTAHIPGLITEELVNWADIILPMESLHYDLIADKFPQSIRKMKLLKEYCLELEGKPVPSEEELQIADPMGGDDADFQTALSGIKSCINIIAVKFRSDTSSNR